MYHYSDTHETFGALLGWPYSYPIENVYSYAGLCNQAEMKGITIVAILDDGVVYTVDREARRQEHG